MGKLKNYEIDAIVNTIISKIEDIKRNKIEKEIKRQKLTQKEKNFLKLLDNIKLLENEISVLNKEAINMCDDIFGYPFYGWKDSTERSILEKRVMKNIDPKYNEVDSIRNKVILANIDGNVQDVIDEILKDYND